MSAVLSRVGRHVSFRCPGCVLWLAQHDPHGYGMPDHTIPVEGAGAWEFNESLERPTLSPSILVRQPWGPERVEQVCHSFVRDGQIQFLNDCTHPLAGQTVPLPPIEERP